MNRFQLQGLCLAVAALLLGACSSSSTSGTSSWANQVSAGGGGGMSALVAAAKSEGQLNLIAVPREWANYSALIDGFQAVYGIKVNVANPYGNSQDEIDTVRQTGKSSRAPDALDLNMKVALANASLFAPYQVAEWSDIPGAQKNSSGLWYQDYGGYMSIGYDSGKLPAVTLVDDLLKPNFKGRVALKGDPNVDPAALAAVMMASLAEGGALDNIGPGVDFFHQLKVKGNLVTMAATATTIKSGLTPVVLDWEYLSEAHVADVPQWQVVVPANAAVGGFYAQAINKNAPHPAAARLWEEYLYSNDGQNLWLRAGKRPVRMRAMENSGSIDAAAASMLPSVIGSPVLMSPDQTAAALQYLSINWAKAIS